MEKMEKVVVIYGLKKSCRDVVRVSATSVENSTVFLADISDYYVPRGIMNDLGLKDTDPVKVTFEKA